MKLAAVVECYVLFKRSLGMHFRTEAMQLHAFCRAIGDLDIAEVKADAVRAFIAGRRPVSAYWRRKRSILNGFYRYAVSRGFATMSPVPATLPKLPAPVTPYIYSVDELTRLLTATDTLNDPQCPLRGLTFRTLLLLLYSTGLRIGEALSLTMHDVDVERGLVTVRNTKFFKTRLVPTGPQLTRELATYVARRRHLPLPAGDASAFFATRTGHRICYHDALRLFYRVRQRAGVRREREGRYQPRLHDLRHTAAVHRIIAWYQAGADVQRLLPHLATISGMLTLPPPDATSA